MIADYGNILLRPPTDSPLPTQQNVFFCCDAHLSGIILAAPLLLVSLCEPIYRLVTRQGCLVRVQGVPPRYWWPRVEEENFSTVLQRRDVVMSATRFFAVQTRIKRMYTADGYTGFG